ncbi:MAG: EF-hand domain-containing protein [Sideroxyarcus sp.]|nr:EF-hand domain-containing protein [Sideroxyarcus sp.]
MSSISGIGGSSTWSMMQSMRQKMAEDLFSKLDTSSQGYIDKSTLQTALENVSSSTSDVDALFTKLDVDGDGKVTKQEFTDILQQLESQLQAGENMRSGGMPPPPPPQDDTGFTQKELTAQLDEIGSSDSKRSGLIASVIENFDQADTDGDGKVSMREAMAFEQSGSTAAGASSSTSTMDSSVTSADSAEKIFKQIMMLMQAYNTGNDPGKDSVLSLLA